jgi:SAM-dependent methyltransferase
VSWVYIGLAVLFLLGARRLRRRLEPLAVLSPSDAAVASEHLFVLAPGVALDAKTRRAASAHARANGLEVLDLVPGDLPAQRLLALAQLVDAGRYRQQRFAAGATAGHAILATSDVLARAGLAGAAPADPVAFLRLARQLKRYACTRTDLAVATGLRARPEDPSRRRAVMREILGPLHVVALVVLPATLGVLALGMAFALPGGAIALGAYHLEPLVAVPLGRLRPRGLLAFAFLRSAIELWSWVRTLAGRWRPDEPDPVESRRPQYQALAGAGGFFEPRRERCPVCDSPGPRVFLRTTDLLQHKPGRFTLERCEACGHIFQNPRLSPAGLDYYYRDFYDGLGESATSAIFGFQTEPYLARARFVEGLVSPRRWLDVGGGHGHFCCAAREVWPAARFDALDFGESVVEGERRGWVDRAYRGLFPELAPELEGAYDVVSMSHYLEHTREPRDEIAAARMALGEGGLLFIEVPNPESSLRKVLGRYWVPWFQPQHQHLLSAKNLERLLTEQGFDVVRRDGGEAHLPVDFFFGAHLWLGRLAPPVRAPWRKPALPALARLRRIFVWTLGMPLLLLARLVDLLLAPHLRRPDRANAYRVLARKRA